MTDFNKEDVIKVARALIKSSVGWHPHGVNNIGYGCCLCNEIKNKIEDVDHKKDCPVLISQDLLKGFENK